MDYQEEQESEMEALEAIYSEEMTMISEAPYTFDVSIRGSNEDTRDDVKVTVTAILRFTLVETYPDAAPLMEITECSENLTEEKSEELISHLDEEASNSIGCVMIFTLVSAAQEFLLQIVDDIKHGIEAERQKEKLEQQRLEELKYKGTPVTLENFLVWKAKFDEEMILTGKRKVVDTTKEKRLTGKQLFERDSTLNESDIKFLTDTGVKVDESLFQDLDDLELDEDFDEDFGDE